MIRPGLEPYLISKTRFRAFTDLGGYPLFYVNADDECVCPTCADVTLSDGDLPQIVAADTNWEDPVLFCADCGERIESAYVEDEYDGRKDEP